MNYKWLRSVLTEGWMKFLPSFAATDRCKKCKEKFTHVWLDGLNKNTFLLCIPCRDEWMHYHRRRVIIPKGNNDRKM